MFAEIKRCLGLWSEWGGLVGFWASFFWAYQIPLIGDPYLLGKYLPQLQVGLPVAGIFLLMLLLGQKLQGRLEPSVGLWMVSLGLVGVHVGGAFFSLDPKVSAVAAFWWLWILCLKGASRGLRWAEDPRRGMIAWGGLLLGSLVWIVDPTWVSAPVLSLGLLWAWMHSVFTPSKVPFMLLSLWCWGWLVILGSSTVLILSSLLWVSFAFWAPRNQKVVGKGDWMLGMVLLGGMLVWVGRDLLPDMQAIEAAWQLWQTHWQTMVFGIGDHQYGQVFAQGATLQLDPTLWRWPGSDSVLGLLETGIAGILATIGFFFFLLRQNAPLIRLKTFIVFFLWLFGNGLWGWETGRLMMGILLFV